MFSPQPLLNTTPSVSRAWVVGLKLAPDPARAYRRSHGAEHVFDLYGAGRTATSPKCRHGRPVSTEVEAT